MPLRRLLPGTLAILLVLALAWTAWPLWSGWQLRQAMRTRDVAALEARVDWARLRANLKPRLVQAVREDAEASTGFGGILKRALGEAVTERGVEYLVTPANLSWLLAGREFVTQRMKRDPAQLPSKSPGASKSNDPGEADPEDPDDPVPPRRLRWAFFETPTRFRLEAIHPRLPGQRIVATLALTGGSWKLVDVQTRAV